MAYEPDLDRIRSSALDSIDQAERNTRLVIIGIAAWEALFLATLLMTVDFHDRLHRLLFIATIGSYTTLALGMIGLGIYVVQGIGRVLRAVETMQPRDGESGG